MNEEQDRVKYAAQNTLLHRHFDPVLTEPIPARMYLRRPVWLDYARAAMLVAIGIAIGLALPLLRPPAPNPRPSPAAAGARAYLVYSRSAPPREVDAKEQDHLVVASKRLAMPLKIPVLASGGFMLGGGLLPGTDGPVAQFVYQDASGWRPHPPSPSRTAAMTDRLPLRAGGARAVFTG